MKHSWKRILSLVLAAAMLLALTIPGFAAEEEEQEAENGGFRVTWEKVDAQPRLDREPLRNEAADEPAPDDVVRVSIVLEEPAVLKAGFSSEGIGSDYRAHQYREGVRSSQDSMEEIISDKVLEGRKLDVVWNLTLAANIISANVPYGKIEAIQNLDGVKDVFLETCYAPMAEGPEMSVAAEMTGSTRVWANGYTGAGSVVAIVDTGLDTDHELFQPEPFLHAIEETGREVALMTEADVDAVWEQLNASAFLESAEGVYLNEKVPFAVNYVDQNLDVTHDNDNQSEHGSHVAGIAAANRYVGEGTFESALDAVKTQGQAPDAQIIVMKVFGQGGGAYDSDYMAAIEDAIVLGADVVNLSLGSANAGFVVSQGYQNIMEDMVNSDTVVAVSAGNAFDWAAKTTMNDYIGAGYLYSDGANFDTTGSPGSFANALTVASVDNDGMTGAFITAFDQNIFYNENTEYGNAPMTTIAGEHEFVFVDGPGVDDNEHIGKEGDAFMALGSEVLSGKIAVCWRGSSSFFIKANAAAAQGAIGVIIANNQDGTIAMNLTGYEYAVPAVSVTMAEGRLLAENAEAVTDAGSGVEYYTGTLTVGESIDAVVYNNEYRTMSDFSSWGVPGDLSLKPEITAPGGNIFSVNGLIPGGQGYESMSGTSMASPQIAGIVALMAQYIKETGLEEQTGLTRRALINSLLMSTAEALIEEESGSYYAVMKQGAGLVNADAAVNADSYILMNADATVSWADGKVKAELGDDPDRTGTYGFSFTLNNLTEEELKYDLSADFFTQDIFDYQFEFLDTWTVPLESAVSWTVDGEEFIPETELDFTGDGVFNVKDAKALLEFVVNGTALADDTGADMDADGEITTYDAYLALQYFDEVSVTVPASGSVEIGVTVELMDIDYYDVCGAYVEGFIFATECDSDDGAIGTTHSIPVLGYYGSWLEPSMHDVGSRQEFAAGEEDRYPYLYTVLGDSAFTNETFGVKYPWSNQVFSLGGNPYMDDEVYMPERNAISADSTVKAAYYTLIRNAAGGIYLAMNGEGEFVGYGLTDPQTAAYYHYDNDKWYNTTTSAALNFTPTGMEDGEPLSLYFYLYPEYYADENGYPTDLTSLLLYAEPISLTMAVDNTAPEILSVTPETGEDDTLTGISLEIGENRYVAAVVVWNEEGWLGTSGEPLLKLGSDPEEEEGAGRSLFLVNGEEEGEIDLGAAGNEHLMIQVYDYAANYVTYKLNLNASEMETGPLSMSVTPEETRTVPGAQVVLTANAEPWGVSDEAVWASSDETVATVDENGVVTAIAEGEVTITATSALNPEASGEAVITVYYPEITLNGAIFDEEGKVDFVAFDTKSLLQGSTDYTKLAPSEIDVADIAWDLYEENLYVSSLNDDFTSTLYTMDPETFALTEIGSSKAAYLGMSPSFLLPMLTEDDNACMMSIYGSDILVIDTSTGEMSDYLDYADYIEGEYLVGISYIAPIYNADEKGRPIELGDSFFLVDNLSNLYYGTLVFDMQKLYLGAEKLTTFGAPIGQMDHYNSLYYDGTNVFWARFASGDENVTDLYMVDDVFNDGGIYHLGAFAEGVWPLAGITEFGGQGSGSADAGESIPDRDFLDSISIKPEEKPEQLLDSLEPFAFSVGGLNAVTVTESSEKHPIDSVGTYQIVVTADEANHNGLYSVEYNANDLVLASAECPIAEYSVIGEDLGVVTVGYASLDEIAAGDEVLILNFYLMSEEETVVTVFDKEVGEKKPNGSKDVMLGEPGEVPEPEAEAGEGGSSSGGTESGSPKPISETEPEKPFPFEDVTKGDWYYADVEAIWRAGLIKGTTDTTFSPYANISRAQIVTILYRMDGERRVDEPCPFEDVAADAYYADAVAWASANGIVFGMSETEFAPTLDITREQFAAIVYRYARFCGLVDEPQSVNDLDTFRDVGSVASWAKEAMAWNCRAKLIYGIGDDTLDPKGNTTRAQAAAVFNRLFKLS